MQSTEIRHLFLDFFKSKGHIIVPSAPIVVKNDPTLFFTNAGMNQFKDYFLGNKAPQYSRIADTQKCLRVSGKHNDLEEVGVDTYHHTMFEMLGNWSFGNSAGAPFPYFKKEAIEWAWKLLTEVYKLDKSRLYVTVFKGDEKENLVMDEEAFNEWKKWIDEEKILPGNKKDNFWEMGDAGPCGPSSEIHYDSRSDEERTKIDGKKLVNQDHPQVIEIWNIVFIQYNRKKGGALEALPAKHVDTGMGFERLVRVLQNKQSNYDTDVFTGTIAEIEKLSEKKYTFSESRQDVAFRVIADHIRAIFFTIADGQLPSNTGAGYVIRRILRRAVRYYFSYLDVKEPMLYKLVPLIAEQFKDVFNELDKQKDFVGKVVFEEEQNFLRTLDKGLQHFEKISSGISGEDAFKLYDTYGFPIDLTKLIASEKNVWVDEAGFEKEMLQQKNRSRAASLVDTEDWVTVNENGSSKFVGYDTYESRSKVLKYRKAKTQGKESFQIVLDTTPFYAESGGQVGDTGVLIFNNEEIKVINTKKENDLIIHFTEKLPVHIEADVLAKIDVDRRNKTAVHHSATHLLHAALRKVLGTHVQQKGSLVNDDYLRFDFSHFSKVTEEEIKSIELLVNEKIRLCLPVTIAQMKKEDAMATGAMALFGEKYGDTVRVVSIDPSYSIELCGGTHVSNTGQLGFFKIIAEAAVGAGIRRIEAVSGKAAEDYIAKQSDLIHIIYTTLKNPKDITKSINNFLQENNELKKQIEKIEVKQLSSLKKDLLTKTETINGINFLGAIVDVSNIDQLKQLCFLLKNDLQSFVVVLAANMEGKAGVAVMLDDTIASSKNIDANKIIKEHIAQLIKGGGGGQKALATAVGQDAGHLQEVIEKVKSLFK